MHIATETNNLQILHNYQRDQKEHITIPEFTPPQLSPEQQLNLHNTLQEYQEQQEQQKQEQRDKLRAFGVDVIENRSKKTQLEIYFSVITQSDIDLNNTTNLLETLREVKKQNDFIEAIATYRELDEKKEEFVTI